MPAIDTANKANIVNILVVDDRAENRVALRAILSSPGYRIVEAESGAEALRCLLAEEFAVLLLDVVMPGMSGFELASAVKQRPKTATVPILFLTGQALDVDLIYKGYRVGAVDYLVKPLVPEMVRAKVAVFADLHRQTMRLEQQSALLIEAERREAELRLLEQRLAGERRYRRLAEAVPDIVWTARPDGTVDYFNQRWFEYTGLRADGVGGSWQEALHPDDIAACCEEWQEANRAARICKMEIRLRAADGSYRCHLGRAVPERDAEDAIVGWTGTFTDIEEQKRLYREARDAVEAGEEFLSIASHELRSPLNSLQLQIEVLRCPPPAVNGEWPPEEVKRKLDIAARQVGRLTRLVTDLMDVSRIRAGRLSLELEEVNLSAVVHDVVGRFTEDAEKAGSTVALSADVPVVGTWDPLRVDQVATNLLTNALKYGAGKPVDVTVLADGPLARLVVRDHGIGIPPEDVDRIFQRFERATAARPYTGLGLGLYIVRQIVESHGGTIRVDSRPGAGSTFTVDLPRERRA